MLPTQGLPRYAAHTARPQHATSLPCCSIWAAPGEKRDWPIESCLARTNSSQGSMFLGTGAQAHFVIVPNSRGVGCRLIWRGMELHRMRRVLWQAVASAEEAAAADGPFRNNQLGTHHADAAAHDSRFCTAELVTAGAPAAGHADEQNTPDPKVGFGDSTPVRLLLSCDGEHAARAASSSFYVGAGPCAEGVESSSNSSGSLGAAAAGRHPGSSLGYLSSHSTASGAAGAAHKLQPWLEDTSRAGEARCGPAARMAPATVALL